MFSPFLASMRLLMVLFCFAAYMSVIIAQLTLYLVAGEPTKGIVFTTWIGRLYLESQELLVSIDTKRKKSGARRARGTVSIDTIRN